MKQNRHRFFALAAFVFGAIAPWLRADTFTVTTLDGGTGAGTLYRAISDAEAMPAGGLHTVAFAADLRGTVALQQNLPLITGTINVNGFEGGLVTISGQSVRRIFEVDASGDLSVMNLTLSAGRVTGADGGAILSRGQLALEGCVLGLNSADCGGAIRHSGSVLIVGGCVFYQNSSVSDSGAIECLAGVATIERSTFLSNSSGYRGGAIGVFGGTDLVIDHCTIVDNASADTGGGLFALFSTTTKLSNSIVSKNRSFSGANTTGKELAGSVTLSGNNFVGGEPMLRPLASYGYAVPYMLPYLDSPVLGAADHSAAPPSLSYDLRGVTWPAVGADLGPVETRIKEVTVDDGAAGVSGSLHDAISALEDPVLGPFDYIDMRGVTQGSGSAIWLISDLPKITESVIIVGLPRHRDRISGDSSRRIFEISDSAHVVLENLTLEDGNANGNPVEDAGGAVLNYGNLTVRGCYLFRNGADSGGAIRNRGTLTVEQSSFVDNEAVSDSGAIENLGGTCRISNSTFHGNHASGHGGALGNFLGDGVMYIDHCTICENWADTAGDGIYNQFGYVELKRSIVSDCGGAYPGDDLVTDFGGTLDQENNFTGPDPKLGPLQGDLFPPAREPLFDSPVVDAVTMEVQQVDQGGRARAEYGASDIGALERYGNSYRAWIALFYDGYTLCSDFERFETWDPLADPDHDGANNITEAITGRHPRRWDANLAPSLSLSVAADTYQSLQVRHAFLEATGQRSTDLKTWSSSGMIREAAILSERVTTPGHLFRSMTPIGSDPKEFLRLHYDAGTLVPLAYTTVGDPGNPADPTTAHGSVGYLYRIGKYEITNHEYATFLNAVDPTGANTLGLYHSSMGSSYGGITLDLGRPAGERFAAKVNSAHLPVNFVSWYSALRFCNWMHNGGTAGAATESGAYTLTGGTPTPANAHAITRSATAKVALPTIDEWQKAAFYTGSGSYSVYPMGGLTAADVNNAGPPGDGDSANYNSTTLQPVGSYTQAQSHYGTYDQGGNVNEWIGSPLLDANTAFRAGGDFLSSADGMRWDRTGGSADSKDNVIQTLGFRVVLLR